MLQSFIFDQNYQELSQDRLVFDMVVSEIQVLNTRVLNQTLENERASMVAELAVGEVKESQILVLSDCWGPGDLDVSQSVLKRVF